MGIYVVLLFLPMLMQHVAIRGDHIDYEKKNYRSLAIFFIILTLALMLRHESVGTDTRNYIKFFDRMSNMGWIDIGKYSVEWGFSYLGKTVSVITKEPQFFLAVSAIITVSLMYPTYKRLCVDPSLTIVIFCTMATFVMMFSGIRQMIAVGIGFLAYECTRKKKPWLFLVCVCAAMLFHTSALMLFFMYPLYRAKITKKSLIVFVPVMVVVFLLNQQIFSVLSVVIERFTKYEGGIVKTGAYTMLILFAVFAVFAFVIPDGTRIDEETIGLRNFLLFSLILQMFVPLHTIAMRMNYYYIIFIPLLLPKIIYCRSSRWDQVAVIGRYVMVGFFSLYFLIFIGGGNNLKVFPYHFFWENVI